MTVKERLIEYLKFKRISKSEFGRSINVSSAFVTSIRSSIQPAKIKSITLKYPDLNTIWLLTGEGDMLSNNGSTINSGVMDIKGSSNKIQNTHSNNSDLEGEIKRLKEIITEKDNMIAEKERMIVEKERTINLLMNQTKP